ncbi:MAG: hypothetical protein AAF799_27740 [Myxococcota bacterium]
MNRIAMKCSVPATLIALGLGATACTTTADADEATAGGSCNGAKCDSVEDVDVDVTDSDEFTPHDYCVGVRGNGPLITSHFASLARIIEHYGLASGVSGGSSGSVSSFMLESIQMNPAVTQCGAASCTPEQAANRASLLLKSIRGYVDVLGTTEEAAALNLLAPLMRAITQGNLEELAQTDPEAARDALVALLESDDLRSLINPELVELLENSPDPAYHVQDILGGLTAAVNFQADSPDILMRPGLIDFEALGEKFGRIASFYAGYGRYDDTGFETFMASCADPGRGLLWPAIAAIRTDSGSTCGEIYERLATEWRADFVANEDTLHSRIDDPVGASLSALISTSVITGESAKRWSEARDLYFAAEDYTLEIDFDEVRFGYWGTAEDLQQVGNNPMRFDDGKTERFMSLGDGTWREALSYSPAEPGLTRAQELPDGVNVSAGGWSDLHPTLVLRNMGCEDIIYVNRVGGEAGSFALGVATLLGMDEETSDDLYGHEGDSAFNRSLREADAIWCTNWNDLSAANVDEVMQDGFNAPMVTDDPTFTAGAQAYENIDPDNTSLGCAVQ